MDKDTAIGLGAGGLDLNPGAATYKFSNCWKQFSQGLSSYLESGYHSNINHRRYYEYPMS